MLVTNAEGNIFRRRVWIDCSDVTCVCVPVTGQLIALCSVGEPVHFATAVFMLCSATDRDFRGGLVFGPTCWRNLIPEHQLTPTGRGGGISRGLNDNLYLRRTDIYFLNPSGNYMYHFL
jgi:hypothetical protein